MFGTGKPILVSSSKDYGQRVTMDARRHKHLMSSPPHPAVSHQSCRWSEDRVLSQSIWL